MAITKQKDLGTLQEPGVAPVEEPAEEHEETADGVEDTLEALASMPAGEGAKVWVYREAGSVDPRTGQVVDRLTYLMSYPPAQKPIEQLLGELSSERGGGVFRIQLRGRGRILKQVAGVAVEPPQSPAAAPASAPAAAAPDGLTAFAQVLAEGMARQGEAIAAALKEMGGARQASGSPLEDALKLVDAIDRRRAPENPPMDPIEQILKVRALERELRDDVNQEGEHPLVSFGKMLAPGLNRLAETLVASRGGAAPMLPTPAIPSSPSQEIPVSEPITDPALAAIVEQLRPFKNQLLTLDGFAQVDGDPGIYADLVVDRTPPASRVQLAELAKPESRDSILKAIHALLPGSVSRAQWWSDFLDALGEALAPE